MDFYLNQVLSAFSSMNAKELGELLDPELTYQETPLETFVKKLDQVFQDLKKGGDTYLEIMPGTCCNLSCNPELIRTAYRFVGNHTRNYLGFRFITEPTEDGKDHCILDIFECFRIQCQQGKDWYGEQFTLIIYEDEKLGYHQSAEEVMHSEISLQAVSELTEGKENFHMEEVEVWLMKYKPTYEFIQVADDFDLYKTLRWKVFYNLFDTLHTYLTFLKRWNKSVITAASQQEMDLPEDVLKEIILEAEGILEDDGCEYFLSTLREEESFQILLWERPLVGKLGERFSRSWAWFKPRQEELVKKYYALTESETDQFLEGYDYVDPRVTLKLLSFHLDIRMKAKERGDFIPLVE